MQRRILHSDNPISQCFRCIFLRLGVFVFISRNMRIVNPRWRRALPIRTWRNRKLARVRSTRIAYSFKVLPHVTEWRVSMRNEVVISRIWNCKCNCSRLVPLIVFFILLGGKGGSNTRIMQEWPSITAASASMNMRYLFTYYY